MTRAGGQVWVLLRSPLTRIYLLLLFLGHNYTQACPIDCDCQTTENGTLVDCRGKQLTAIPSDVPRDALEIDLSDNNIMHLNSHNPAIIFSKVKKLNFDFNRVQTLFEGFFQKYPNVEEISLDGNTIGDIFPDTFNGLTKLKYIYLQNNQLLKIKTGTFQGIALMSLNLEKNRIGSVEEGAFDGASVNTLRLDYNDFDQFSLNSLAPLQVSLKYFSVSYNKNQPLILDKTSFYGFRFEALSLCYNGITNSSFLTSVQSKRLDLTGNIIPIGTMQQYTNLNSLQELILVNNSIQAIGEGYLQQLPSLTWLDVSSNKITIFTGNLLINNSKLKRLILSDNQIKEFPSDLAANCPELSTVVLSSNRIPRLHSERLAGLSLTELDLSFNSIQVMDESLGSVFDSIPDLKLNGNPLHCNCEMRWFREWLSQRELYTGADYCYSPKYSYIIDVKPEEFICMPPQILYITPDKNVTKGEDVFLSCTASGDPAPEIVFLDPKNEGISILPQQNRTNTKTYAMWKVNEIPVDRAGIYTCRAANVVGNIDATICVSVISDSGTEGLGKCVTLTTVTTTTTIKTTTSSTKQTTTTTETVVPEVDTTSVKNSMTSLTTRNTQIPETSSSFIPVTSTPGVFPPTRTDGSAGGVSSGDPVDTKLIVILCCTIGGVVVIIVLLAIVVCSVKKRRANGRYVVSHKEADILEYHKMNGKPPDDFNCNGHVFL